ncbi:hypothetical protein DL95DRAFT_88148 [Leptodontidium sp. 2 PMI_412]|nr:hypothetical protein DL95DRAFT_88148 [Leptodontidium sp. 2 PMI_412]
MQPGSAMMSSQPNPSHRFSFQLAGKEKRRVLSFWGRLGCACCALLIFWSGINFGFGIFSCFFLGIRIRISLRVVVFFFSGSKLQMQVSAAAKFEPSRRGETRSCVM